MLVVAQCLEQIEKVAMAIPFHHGAHECGKKAFFCLQPFGDVGVPPYYQVTDKGSPASVNLITYILHVQNVRGIRF